MPSVKATGRRINAYLPEELVREYKARAQIEGRAASELLADAIRRYLESPRPARRRRRSA